MSKRPKSSKGEVIYKGKKLKITNDWQYASEIGKALGMKTLKPGCGIYWALWNAADKKYIDSRLTDSGRQYRLFPPPVLAEPTEVKRPLISQETELLVAIALVCIGIAVYYLLIR